MTKRIYVAVPDGVDGQGGVARQMGYFWTHHQRSNQRAAYDIRLLVTRGNYGRYWSILFFLWACLRLVLVCARKRIDLLHVNVASRGSTYRKMTLCWIAGKFGVPFVVHLHGGGYPEFYGGARPIAKRLIGWMFGQAVRVVVLGDGWKEFVVSTIAVPADKVVVVPNGVPVPAMPESDREDTNLCHLVFLGHLLERKGVGELLHALASESVRDLPWRITLAGSGELAYYQDMTVGLDLVEKVNFVGWLNDRQIARLYADADVLVLPSHTENLPLVILEAMAAKVPVIATTVGAIPEVIVDGKTGLLVSPEASKPLAAAIEKMISDTKLRAALAEQGRYRYDMLYNIETYHQHLLEVYGLVVR